MAAATPIIPPSIVIHPQGFRPNNFPDEIARVWDEGVMSLSEDVYFPVSRDCFIEDLGANTLAEVHLAKTVRALPALPVTCYLKSTNATDKQPIQIEYIDNQYNYQSAIFMLDGTTPVELPLMYRVLTITNISSTDIGNYLTSIGIVGFNLTTTIGNVSVYYGAGSGLPSEATTLQYFPANYVIDTGMKVNKSMDSSFTVPKGFTGFPFGFETILGKTDEIFFSIETRTPGGPWVSRIPLQMFENILSRRAKPRAIPELYDLRVLARSDATASSVPVSFGYQMLLIKNAT